MQYSELEPYIGKQAGPFLAWDEVNAPMIRHWCEAMGDDNPIYTDESAAREAGHPGLVAPPTMLQAWSMVGFGGKAPPGSAEAGAFSTVVSLLAEAGYAGVVAVNCEQEYHRYLQPGDRIYFRSELESISEEKTTALGTGYFVTDLSTFYNQHDEVVGTMRFRVLRYRPHANGDSDG